MILEVLIGWLSWIDIGNGRKFFEVMIDSRFWKGLEDVLKYSQLFVVLMHLDDPDAQHCMGYILHAFRDANLSS